MIHHNSQRRMAQCMNPRKTIEIAASHALLASQATVVSDLIDAAAGSVT
jgi:hypothetical protein